MLTAFSSITGEIVAVERPPQGCVFDVTLLTAECGKFILKTGDTSDKIAELEQEARVLDALAEHRALVPAYLGRDGDRFLFSYVPGCNLAHAAHNVPDGIPCEDIYRTLARAYGAGLRTIHDTFRPDLPRPYDWLDQAAARCVAAAANGPDLAADEHSIHAGRSLSELNDFIQRERHLFSSMVTFCHGDWCMPNVLIEDGAFAGVVDWSNGGYKDARYDLATGLWSLRRNGLRGYEDEYLRAYGYEGSAESLAFFEAIYAVCDGC